MKLPTAAALLLATAFAPAARAQTAHGLSRLPEFVLDQWDTDDGLPQNSVTSLAQTADGYLWVGTFGGLARFDGVRFTPFLSREHPEIPSDRILALTVDSTGILWIGTERGLVSYDGSVFTGYRKIAGLPDATVAALRPDSRGDLWIGFFDAGLSRLHAGQFRHFGVADGLRHGTVNGMTEDELGSMFLAGTNGGSRINLATLRITSGAGILPSPELDWPLIREPDGAVWYVGKGGMYRRRAGQLTKYGREVGLLGVPSAAMDLDGNVIAGSAAGLLYLRPGPPATGRRYPLADGRLDYFIRWVFVDREGTRWIGTDTDGLLRLRPRLFTVVTQADGLLTDIPLALLEDRAGRVWVGSNCHRTSIIDGERISPWRVRPGCMWAVAEAPDGTMWMSSYAGGLSHVVGDSVRTFRVTDGLANDLVLAIHVDRSGTVWAGTGGGVSRYRDGVFTRIDTANGLPQANVQMIVEDRGGTLWFGTYGGLAKLENGRVTAYTEADGLHGNSVRSLYQDADGAYWIGTYGGGLTRFKNGRFVNINRSNGLFDDVVSAILEDDQGRLWMSGNRGIFHARRADLNAFADGVATSVHSVGYGRQDGLLNPETNGGFQPSAMKTRDGRLWFSTVKGLAIIDPRTVLANTRPPGVTLEQMMVDGKPVPIDGPVKVSHAARRFEFRFTGLSSPAPEQITFRYRMLDMERSWTVGRDRVAYYSALRPGRYRFEVDAANRDGIWNDAGVGIDVVVEPPFWMTWWFVALCAGTAIAVLGSWVHARAERQRLANAAQQEFSRRLIATQEEERRRIAGELHDSVGQDLLVVKNRAALALERSRDASAVVTELTQISDVITDAIRDVRAIAHNLRPYQLDRVGLGAAIRSSVAKAAEGTNIRFTVEARDVDGVLPADGEIAVFRIVQECVNNVLKHSQASEATVSAFRVEGELRVIVVDNGRGVGASPSGFGMSSIAERVRLLGGRHEVDSEPDAGTTHRIAIPIAGATHG